MEIRLLGVVEVVDDADRAAVVRGEHLRALLVALALRCGNPVSTDRLIETLWGEDPPEGSANALQRHVSALRRVLGASELVVRRGPGYVLDVEPTTVDALRFRALVRQGREAMAAGDAKAAGALLADALCLWRGDAIADSALSGRAVTDAAQLAEDRIAATEARIDADLALGRHAELVAELEGLVARHPFREHFVAQLMLALARSGRQAEALRAYQSARVVLGEELGLEPSTELRAIETAILTQDPTLAGSAAPRVVRARTNLRTPLTSLVGRSVELDALTALASTQRLVTLVGSGGAGKTRLAIEVARRWLESSDAEVWVVELAEVGDEAGVVPAIEAAVDLPDDAPFRVASGPRPRITGGLAAFRQSRRRLRTRRHHRRHDVDLFDRTGGGGFVACSRQRHRVFRLPGQQRLRAGGRHRRAGVERCDPRSGGGIAHRGRGHRLHRVHRCEDLRVGRSNRCQGVGVTTGGDIVSSPAVSGGVVYISSTDHNVYALSAATGALVWTFATGDKVVSSPAVSGGVVYIGSNDQNVYALSAATGALVWRFATGAGVTASPAVANGTVYIGSFDHRVYALRATDGAAVWTATLGASVAASPSVANGVVYVAAIDGIVHALDATTGATVAPQVVTGDRVFRSSPAVSNGVVYVGTLEGRVFALG